MPPIFFTGEVTVRFSGTQFLFSLLYRRMAVQNRNISLLICFAASVTPLQRVEAAGTTLFHSPPFSRASPASGIWKCWQGTKLILSPLQCSYFATFLFPKCVRGCTCQPEVVYQGQWVLCICVCVCSIYSSPSMYRTGSKKEENLSGFKGWQRSFRVIFQASKI